MKKAIFLLGAFVGCREPERNVEITVAEEKHTPTPKLPNINVVWDIETTQDLPYGIFVMTVDSCQYVFCRDAHAFNGMHHQYCKFCAQRKIK